MALGSIQAIEETGQILNPKNLEKAIEAIDSAERVYFFLEQVLHRLWP